MRHTTQSDVAFGPRLKAYREHRGITLDRLAASTKIKGSLFAELEDDNLVHWPEGIYRRAWLRAYLIGIGMPPEPTLEEFARLFPDEADRSGPERVDAAPFRLTFAASGRRFAPVMRLRIIDALLSFMIVLACGGVLVRLSGVSFWTASGTVALIWYPVVSVLYGGASPGGLRRSWSAVGRSASRTGPRFRALLSRVSSRCGLPLPGGRMRSFVSKSRVEAVSALAEPGQDGAATIQRSAATNHHAPLQRFPRISAWSRAHHRLGSLSRRFSERSLKLLPRLLRRRTRRVSAATEHRHNAAGEASSRAGQASPECLQPGEHSGGLAHIQEESGKRRTRVDPSACDQKSNAIND